jgi:HD-like signal output (HDOD) protein
MQKLDNYGSRNEPLPVDTMAAIQLLDLFRDPDHDVDRIVEFISQDPRLAAETLRRCNNVVFGGKERVTDIFEAVSRLGYYELYDIISRAAGTPAAPAIAESARAKRPAHADFGGLEM